MAAALQFVHHFSAQVTCALVVDDAPPKEGRTLAFTYEWNRRGPHPKYFRAYKQWVFSVCVSLAKRWQRPVLYGIEVAPNTMEIWHFKPGQAGRLIKKGALGTHYRTSRCGLKRFSGRGSL